MSDGSGLPPFYPDLPKSDLLTKNIEELPCLILKGRKGQIIETVVMPGVNLSAVDISNLINYMAHKWKGSLALPMNEIAELIQACE